MRGPARPRRRSSAALLWSMRFSRRYPRSGARCRISVRAAGASIVPDGVFGEERVSSIPQVVRSDEAADQVACDALVIGAFAENGNVTLTGADGLEGLLEGQLMEAVRDSAFRAKQG